MEIKLSPEAYIGYAVGILIFLVISIPLQILNLSALFHKESCKKELTPFLMNIAVANLIFIFASFPSSFVSAVQQRWAFNADYCKAEGFLAGTASIAMIIFLSVIVAKIHSAIYDLRFVAVPSGQSYKKTILIALVWLFSVAVMLPPLTGLTSMVEEGGGTNCAPDWKPKNTRNRIYAFLLTLCAFFIPIGSSVRHLYRIYHSLLRHTYICKQTMNNVRTLLEYKTVSRMVAVAIFLCIITWTPYCIGVLISLFGGVSLLDGKLSLLPTLIAKSSAVYLPIVYITFNGRIRKLISARLIGTRLFKRSDRIQPSSTVRQTIDDKRVPLRRICVTNLTSADEIEPADLVSTSTASRFSERRGAIKCSLNSFL